MTKPVSASGCSSTASTSLRTGTQKGEDLFTEVSLEIEDAHAHRRESRAYRAQILSFITRALAEKFPQRTETGSPNGPRTIRGELPDLVRSPKEIEELVRTYDGEQSR
jgi:hypothetical protein